MLTGFLAALASVLSLLGATTAPEGRVCRFGDDRITESSGLVYSRTGSVLFTHNDSGDSARFFAVDPHTCRTTATYVLADPAEAFDWEDMARGTAADGSSVLLFGDIGDNLRFRDSVTVYEVNEPSGRAGDALADRVLPVRAVYELTYPEGPVDAESLAALPDGRLLIVTKVKSGDSQVYVTVGRPGPGVNQMTKLADLDLGSLTGADATRDGRLLAVRTATTAYVFDLGRGLTDPIVVPLRPTRQGEAIAWSPDGMALATSSEGSGVSQDPTSGVVDRYLVRRRS